MARVSWLSVPMAFRFQHKTSEGNQSVTDFLQSRPGSVTKGNLCTNRLRAERPRRVEPVELGHLWPTLYFWWSDKCRSENSLLSSAMCLLPTRKDTASHRSMTSNLEALCSSSWNPQTPLSLNLVSLVEYLPAWGRLATDFYNKFIYEYTSCSVYSTPRLHSSIHNDVSRREGTSMEIWRVSSIAQAAAVGQSLWIEKMLFEAENKFVLMLGLCPLWEEAAVCQSSCCSTWIRRTFRSTLQACAHC